MENRVYSHSTVVDADGDDTDDSSEVFECDSQTQEDNAHSDVNKQETRGQSENKSDQCNVPVNNRKGVKNNQPSMSTKSVSDKNGARKSSVKFKSEKNNINQ